MERWADGVAQTPSTGAAPLAGFAGDATWSWPMSSRHAATPRRATMALGLEMHSTHEADTSSEARKGYKKGHFLRSGPFFVGGAGREVTTNL